jgi:cytochrome c556
MKASVNLILDGFEMKAALYAVGTVWTGGKCHAMKQRRRKSITGESSMRKTSILVSAVVLGGAAYSALVAAPADPAAVQKVVDARVAHYKDIGKSAKAIHDELGQSQPNLASVQTNSRVIEALAKQLPTWFPAGTGQQPGVKSEALPVIWQQNALFRQRAAGLEGAAHAVTLAAASGNVAATQAAASNLGGACKACHETFREKK